jgi:hypothetical protein
MVPVACAASGAATARNSEARRAERAAVLAGVNHMNICDPPDEWSCRHREVLLYSRCITPHTM